MKKLFTLSAALLLAWPIASAMAGTDLVKLPENYQSNFVRYTVVDNAKRKKVRFMYVNPEALAAAKAGQPAPHGTVVIMEDRKAKLDAAGKLAKDSKGRFIPTGEVLRIFVQEKQRGWGAEYPADKRNGEWEYAVFEANGERRKGQKFARCFSCHNDEAAADDYTFTFATFVDKVKK